MTLPKFPKTPAEITALTKRAIDESKARTSSIAALKESATFENGIVAQDDDDFLEHKTAAIIHLIESVHPDTAMRDAAFEASKLFSLWGVEKAFHQGLYEVTKNAAGKNPSLTGEDKKLLDESLKDFKRRGMELPEDQKSHLKKMVEKLDNLELEFSKNINDYQDELWVTQEELKGLDSPFISSLKKQGEKFQLTLAYPHLLPVMEFCEVESTRKQLQFKKQNTAVTANTLILKEMIKLRDQMAHLLGYSSYNDYVLSDRMASSTATAENFLLDLRKKLDSSAEAEKKRYADLKAKKIGASSAQLSAWDTMFYSSLYQKEYFQINQQELRYFFELNKTLDGMFKTVEKIFSVKIIEVSDFDKWHPDVRAFKIEDLKNNLYGHFYLDLHPREGKYGHACCMGLFPSKIFEGKRETPIATMICNFSPSTKDSPSLLSHSDVETLFHEFGHVLHHVLSKTKYAAFAGTSVAWDFVEAPSQVLEHWANEVSVLQTFAIDTRDGKTVIPSSLVEKMNEAKKASMPLFYCRQIAFALADLELHKTGEDKDPIKICNDVQTKIYMAPQEGTAFAAGWGHMTGYASGYYSYAWADVMASDLYSRFSNPFDEMTGEKLRTEIFEKGSSRKEQESLEAFLGRPLSSESFLKELGLVA